MKIYPINNVLSDELADKFPDATEQKMCFKNVWNLLIGIYSEYGDRIKIGYGYCRKEEKSYAVYHCFIVLENKVIDTTLPEKGNIYYIVEEYDYKKYLQLINLNNNKLDFSELNNKKEPVASALLLEGVLPIG